MTIQRNPLTFLMLFLCLMLQGTMVLAEEDEDSEAGSGITDYIEMDPAFVTHVGEPSDRVTYLKAEVTLRASAETTRPAVEAHMPRLRHELVMLFGEQTDIDRLSSPEGQQALRDEALKRINAALDAQQTGEAITGVLFTEFVVQR
ncbi:MAG: flagellar basal body protein FliL [Marinobacter sp. 34-60-7]|nr:MAG: flagellar basal body protein FliL [Marinobacter sp. 34-60-7]